LVMVIVLVAAAAGAGLGTYFLVLRPMFAEAPEPGTAVTDKIPSTAVIVDFTDMRATVRTGENALPALLQYSVCFTCANQATALLIESWRQLFAAMLVELHDSRTKEELTDPAAKEALLRQAKHEANALLKRVQDQEDPRIEVLGVMYTEHTVIEL